MKTTPPELMQTPHTTHFGMKPKSLDFTCKSHNNINMDHGIHVEKIKDWSMDVHDQESLLRVALIT